MDDDFANIAVHMRKLIGSDHPVLHTVKRLVYQGKNKMQVKNRLTLGLERCGNIMQGVVILFFKGERPHHASSLPSSRTQWI